MSKKHILANKRRWANRSKEKNSEIMSKIVSKRWQKTSIEERKRIGKMLLIARQNKKNTIKTLS